MLFKSLKLVDYVTLPVKASASLGEITTITKYFKSYLDKLQNALIKNLFSDS